MLANHDSPAEIALVQGH